MPELHDPVPLSAAPNTPRAGRAPAMTQAEQARRRLAPLLRVAEHLAPWERRLDQLIAEAQEAQDASRERLRAHIPTLRTEGGTGALGAWQASFTHQLPQLSEGMREHWRAVPDPAPPYRDRRLSTHVSPPEQAGDWQVFHAPFDGASCTSTPFLRGDLRITSQAGADAQAGTLDASDLHALQSPVGGPSLSVQHHTPTLGVWYRMRRAGHVRIQAELEVLSCAYELQVVPGSLLSKAHQVLETRFLPQVNSHSFSQQGAFPYWDSRVNGSKGFEALGAQVSVVEPGKRFWLSLDEDTAYAAGQEVFVGLQMESVHLCVSRCAAMLGRHGLRLRLLSLAVQSVPGGVPREAQAPPPEGSPPVALWPTTSAL